MRLSVFLVNFIKKEAPTQVFSCENCKIFKRTYFEEQQREAASKKIVIEGIIHLVKQLLQVLALLPPSVLYCWK